MLSILVGEIVYMGPVKLNQNSSVNKAGKEVDVIPIMRSPQLSPALKRRKLTRHAKSDLVLYAENFVENMNTSSLPNLQVPTANIFTTTNKQYSNFLSVNSLHHESVGKHRSLDSIQRGSIMSAVVSWLEKSNGFRSQDNINHQSILTNVRVINITETVVHDKESFRKILTATPTALGKSSFRISAVLRSYL